VPGHIRSRLTYANVMATVAVFVALGGTGYAAAKINGKTLKNRTVSGKKLMNRTIGESKIKRNALTGTSINESTLATVPSAAEAASLGGSARASFYNRGDVDARLPRSAEERSFGEQAFTQAAGIDRIHVDLTAPRDGFALVLGTGEVHPSAPITAAHDCVAELSVNEIPQVGRIATFIGGDKTNCYRSLAQSWVVPVTAGTHTFTLHLSINPNVSVNCNDTLDSASSSLNAVWLPG
jgi:hypothetical protein